MRVKTKHERQTQRNYYVQAIHTKARRHEDTKSCYPDLTEFSLPKVDLMHPCPESLTQRSSAGRGAAQASGLRFFRHLPAKTGIHARSPYNRTMTQIPEHDEDDSAAIHEDRLWRDKGWTARVIKNEDDDGWAVAMILDGEPEPALIGPWTMGRDKKKPQAAGRHGLQHPDQDRLGSDPPPRAASARDAPQEPDGEHGEWADRSDTGYRAG